MSPKEAEVMTAAVHLVRHKLRYKGKPSLWSSWTNAELDLLEAVLMLDREYWKTQDLHEKVSS